MFHFRSIRNACAVLLLLFAVLGFTAANANFIQDTIGYDSIQDLRIEQLQQQILRRFRNIESEQAKTSGRSDSLATEIDVTQKQLVILDSLARTQAEALGRLESELDRTRESMFRYRSGIQRFLWVSGTILLLLLLASFVFFLIRSSMTRRMIDKLRNRQIKLRMKLKMLSGTVASERKLVRAKLKSQKKSILRTTRSEIRKQRKKRK